MAGKGTPLAPLPTPPTAPSPPAALSALTVPWVSVSVSARPAPASQKAVPPRSAAPDRQGVPPRGASTVGKAAGFVEQIVSLANSERKKAGCRPLRSDSRLRKAAQGHANDMADRDYYAHDTPEGRDGGDRITAAGYRWSTWAENIHRGPKTPKQAMKDWMNSEGHRRNILNCAFKHIGVGVSLSSNGPWWVQDFGAKR
ncbi:CAP domain-containing protein [Streptomyces sp. ISL-36]|nr:CAP domain-containing protein [Streptomyces sp. ISL-36]